MNVGYLCATIFTDDDGSLLAQPQIYKTSSRREDANVFITATMCARLRRFVSVFIVVFFFQQKMMLDERLFWLLLPYKHDIKNKATHIAHLFLTSQPTKKTHFTANGMEQARASIFDCRS